MFVIKQGDRLPSLEVIVKKKADGEIIDLSTASSVTFRMWKQRATSGTYKVDSAAVIASAVDGVVRYDWTTTDTNEVGDYLAEFVIVWPLSKQQTIPTNGVFHVRVVDAGLPG